MLNGATAFHIAVVNLYAVAWPHARIPPRRGAARTHAGSRMGGMRARLRVCGCVASPTGNAHYLPVRPRPLAGGRVFLGLCSACQGCCYARGTHWVRGSLR